MLCESIWAVKLRELWERKFKYAAQILSLIDFRAKERLLAVYMSFSVCKLFCCFLTGWIEGTILLAIMNSLLRCLHDLATELIVGKIMYKFDKQCKFYILGQGNTYSFIYFLFFILLLNYVAANAFGIWNLRKLGRVWPTEWHPCYCERFEPRSHFKSRLGLIVWVNVVTVNKNSPIQDYTFPLMIKLNLHVIVYTTLILICLLQDAFLDIASFKPWHE